MKKCIKLMLMVLCFTASICYLTSCMKKPNETKPDAKYDINFIVDNAIYDTISTSGNETLTLPQNPNKTGFVFDGWYFDKDVWLQPFTANYYANKSLTSDVSVYAKWGEILDDDTSVVFISFTIIGDYEYSSIVSTGTESLSLNELVQVASTSSWALYSDAQCNQIISNKVATLQMGENTYYVKVTAENGATQVYTLKINRTNSFTVNFNTNGGTQVEPQIVAEGELATRPTTTKTGYTFAGWDFDFSNPITANITITASWLANQYKVTYDADGGELLNQETNVIFDEEFTLEVPTKKGHNFLGWYINEDEKLENGAWSIAENVSVTAKWQVKTFNVYYNRNSMNAGIYHATVVYGEPMPEITHSLTLTGYVFMGYYDSKDYSGKQYYDENKNSDVIYDLDEDITLYPKWRSIEYTITFLPGFDDYDETQNGKMEELSLKYTSSGTLTKNSFNRIGYKFDKWYCPQTQTYYEDQRTISSSHPFTYTDGAKLTFIAQWKGINVSARLTDLQIYKDVTVTLDPNYLRTNPDTNKLEIAPKTKIVLKNGATFNPTQYEPYRPQENGIEYEFAGWQYQGKSFNYSNTKITYDIELKAQWCDRRVDNDVKFIHHVSNTSISGIKWFSFVQPYPERTLNLNINGLTNTANVYVATYYSNDPESTSYVIKKLSDVKGDVSIEFDSFELNFKTQYYVGIKTIGKVKSISTSFEYTKPAVHGTVSDEQTVVYGENFTLRTPTKTGYDFKGWYDGVDGTGNQITDSTGAGLTVWNMVTYTQLYAKWEKAIYTLSFVTNGGNSLDPIQREYETVINELPIPTQTGKSFDGWYLNSSFTGSKQTSFTFTGNKTLYAKWIDYEVNITHSNITAIKDSADLSDVTNYSATAVDTDGTTRDVIATLISGEFKAGEIITVELSSLGRDNILGKVTLEIKVYGTPSIEYNSTKDYINLTDRIDVNLFEVQAKDSFNENVEASVSVKETDYKAGDLVTIIISATDVVANTKTIEIANVKVYGEPTITRDKTIDKMNETDTISNELFKISAKDSFNEDVTNITTILESGEINGGNIVTIKTTATDSKGNTKSISYEVRVYGVPEISDATTKKFKLSEEITIEKLGVIAKDSFDENITDLKLTLKSGEVKAGEVVVYTVTATDCLGNNTSKDIENVMIYGVPTITYNTEKLTINEHDQIDETLFEATAKDSFGADLNVKVLVKTGEVVGGTKVIFEIISTDELGNVSTEQTAEIKVYSSEDITISYDLTITKNIKLTSVGEEWNATATNSFDEICDVKLELAEGFVLEGGNVVDLYIVATDIMGNVKRSAVIQDVKIYDIPTLTYLKDNSSIKDNENPEDLFVVKDSFGLSLEYSVEVINGSLTEDKITYKITATDIANNILVETKELDVIIISTNESILYLYKNGEFVGTQRVRNKESFKLPNYDGYDTVWSLNETILTDAQGNSLNAWDKECDEYQIETTLAIITYTIEYDLDGGVNDELNPSEYTIESDDITLNYPSKSGYSFIGWFNSSTEETEKDVIIKSGTFKNLSYIAIWEANEYTVSFDVNGGDGEINPMIVAFDSEVELPKPTRVGYDFVNWSHNSTIYSDGVWKTANDITLIANWSAKTDTKYTVYHYQENVSDENFSIAETETKHGTTATEVEAKVKEYEGFTSPEAENVYILADGSAVVEYFYTRNSYTITVMGNGGTNNEITQKFGSILNIREWSTKDNLEIEGFYYDVDLQVRFTNETMPAQNETVYARWKGEALPSELIYSTCDLNGETYYSVDGYTGSSETLIIPTHIKGVEVKEIGGNKFNSTIKNLVVPNSVTYIQSGSFSNTSNLESISLPFVGTSLGATLDSPTNVFGILFRLSFCNCNVSMSNGVDTVSWSKYYKVKISTELSMYEPVEHSVKHGTWQYSCYNYQQTLSGVGTVYYHNFYYFMIPTSLTTVAITNATKIPTNAFINCENITKITLNDGVTEIGENAFRDCFNLEHVDIGNSVETIGKNAFQNCSKLTNIELPETLKTIEEYAFYNANLTEVVIPNNIEEIYRAVFKANNISSLKLPNNLKNIGYNAFEDNPTLTQVEFPNSLTGVSDSAFRNTNLKEIVLPSSVTNLGIYAFANNPSVEEVVIPTGVKNINSGLFLNCTNLTKVVLHDNILTIKGYAFKNTKLTEFVVPTSLTTIGTEAFMGTAIETLNIPTTVAEIGQNAFVNCDYLVDITIPYIGKKFDTTNTDEKMFKYVFGEITETTPLRKVVISKYKINNIIYTHEMIDGAFLDRTDILELKIYSVASIPNNAFKNCSNMKTFEYSGICDSIGEYAFYNASSLETIDITKITSIGKYAFYGAASIKSLEINENISTIKEYAFHGMTSITSLKLPNKLSSVYTHAFYGMESLTTLELPESLYSIGSHAFYGLKSLTKLTLPKKLNSIGSYSFAEMNLITEIIVPDSVKEIGEGAFYECNNLESITLPFIGGSKTGKSDYDIDRKFGFIFGYEKADAYTMSGMTDGTTFYDKTNSRLSYSKNAGVAKYIVCSDTKGTPYMPEGTTWQHSYYSTYKSGYYYLTSYYYFIPKSLKNVTITTCYFGDSAFVNCSNIETISLPEDSQYTQSISNYEFYNCSSLKEIYIPKYITNVYSNALSGCSSLEKIVVSPENTYFDSRDNCNAIIETNTNTLLFGCKNTVVPSSVTKIADNAFLNINSLTNIVVPNNVTSIGINAFKGCNSLNSITVAYVGSAVDKNNYLGYFFGAETYLDNASSVPASLEKVVITQGSNIADNMFYGVSGLKEVIIPNSVENIGINVFAGCSSLTKLSVPFIGSTIDSTETNFLAYLFGGASYSNLSVIPTTLQTVIISSPTSKVGDNVFNSCSSLTNVILPTELTSIGQTAFYNCNSLEEISIPASVTSIGFEAFKNCTSLTKTTCAGIENWLKIEFDNSQYSNPLAYSHKLYEGDEEFKELNIPKSITEISKFAFYDCSSLTSIYIPNTLKAINSWAFFNCVNVTTIKFEENSTLETIGNAVFKQCSGITEITIPNSVTYLGDYVFRDCGNLIQAILPNSIEFVGAELFCNCRKITEIIVPNTVTEIRQFAFFSCNSLETVVFADNSQLTTIGRSAFYNCHSLNITIPSSVISIGETAFGTYDIGANAVKQGILGIKFEENSQLQTIGKEAFIYCKNLAVIVIPQSVATIGADAFKYCPALTIYLEQDEIPAAWDSTWNSLNRPVYLFSATQPTEEGNFWYYKNDEIAIW